MDGESVSHDEELDAIIAEIKRAVRHDDSDRMKGMWVGEWERAAARLVSEARQKAETVAKTAISLLCGCDKHADCTMQDIEEARCPLCMLVERDAALARVRDWERGSQEMHKELTNALARIASLEADGAAHARQVDELSTTCALLFDEKAAIVRQIENLQERIEDGGDVSQYDLKYLRAALEGKTP